MVQTFQAFGLWPRGGKISAQCPRLSPYSRTFGLCSFQVSKEVRIELWTSHKPDFKLTPGQKQVMSQDIEYGQPRKSDVLDT
jgi:hypothetical protein